LIEMQSLHIEWCFNRQNVELLVGASNRAVYVTISSIKIKMESWLIGHGRYQLFHL